MSKKAYIFGAGGFGKEIRAFLEADTSEAFTQIDFLDDSRENALRIEEFEKLNEPNASIFIAAGEGRARRNMLSRLNGIAGLNFPPIVSKDTVLVNSNRITIERGVFLLAGSILTTDIRLGEFSVINIGCTVGHDVTIGKFVSIMPGSNISGGVTIEEGAYLGTGVKVLPNISIGRDAIIGAGAVVNKNVPSGETWVGIPAKRK